MKKLLKIILILILKVVVLAGIVIGIFALNGYNDYKSVVDKVPLSSKVYDLQSKASYVKYGDINNNYFNAVVAVEDERYWQHGAIDFISIIRALVSNASQGKYAEGASTITMQVAKNYYFMEDGGLTARDRKGAEIFIAFDLQNNYSKEEILEMYANMICFGAGYTGIKDAAWGYFKKDPKDLNLGECVMLAGVPNAPSLYSPKVDKDLCKSRMGKVISSMVKNNYITQEEADGIDMSFIDEIYEKSDIKSSKKKNN